MKRKKKNPTSEPSLIIEISQLSEDPPFVAKSKLQVTSSKEIEELEEDPGLIEKARVFVLSSAKQFCKIKKTKKKI